MSDGAEGDRVMSDGAEGDRVMTTGSRLGASYAMRMSYLSTPESGDHMASLISRVLVR
jgi:hypothetical protein